jgi:hypothetical protein
MLSKLSPPPGPVSRPPPAVAVLAEHAAEIRRLGRLTVENVVEIGRRLTECKKLVGHGNWLPWLEREFGWSERTARRFMQAHEFALAKSDKLADLNIGISSLHLLAAPSTPKEAVDEVVERAQAGEPASSVAKVKRIIDTARGKRPARKRSPRNMTTTSNANAILKPSHERIAQKLFNLFTEAPAEVRRHFFEVVWLAIGPTSTDKKLENKCRQLESRVTELEAENAALRAKLKATSSSESVSANTVIAGDPGPFPTILLRKPSATGASDSMKEELP